MQITSDHIKILLAGVLVRQTVMLYLTFLTLLDKHIYTAHFISFWMVQGFRTASWQGDNGRFSMLDAGTVL